VVAPCDRRRVLAQWSQALPPGTPPLVEHSLPFAAIRTLRRAAPSSRQSLSRIRMLVLRRPRAAFYPQSG